METGSRVGRHRRVLVTGATGYIGGRLIPCLLERGYGVRCFARDPDRLSG
ncbi:MAG: NAD-dependent epimerase/dehydratase family protein, partial [Rhodothermales bacterium]